MRDATGSSRSGSGNGPIGDLKGGYEGDAAFGPEWPRMEERAMYVPVRPTPAELVEDKVGLVESRKQIPTSRTSAPKFHIRPRPPPFVCSRLL